MFVDMNQIGIKIATVIFNVKFRKYVPTERIRLFYVKFRKYVSTEVIRLFFVFFFLNYFFEEAKDFPND